MSETLKPCPFCGGEANQMWREWDSGAQDYWIECSKCYAETITFHEEAEAIEAWNSRAERACRNVQWKSWPFTCSECDSCWDIEHPNYCPNCGARVVVE